MKTVYYIRHAKSSWSNHGLKDIDRPLNKRGLADGAMMSQRLKKLSPNMDGLLSSPSKRTRMTFAFFQDAYGLTENESIIDAQLYHCSASYFFDSLLQLPQAWDHVMVFGHNPGITVLLNEFSSSSIDNVPTCGIGKIELNIDDWQDIHKAESDLKFFIYPKLFADE